MVGRGAYEFRFGVGASLDIKPGACPNPLNVRSRGVVPMAVLGSESFDVTEIDVDSLALTRTDGAGGCGGQLNVGRRHGRRN